MDDLDRAQAYEERERESALSRIVRPRIVWRDRRRKVYCRDCGDPVPRERMAAVPYATRCSECESAKELQSRRAC